MTPIRRILAAVKDTEASVHHAVEKAALLGKTLGASVELFHAIDESLYVDSPKAEAALWDAQARRRDWHLGRLQAAASRLCEAGVRASAYAEWDFPSYEAIIRRAISTKADLIVADCRERSRLAHWLLHLTDWELLKLSPVPVLLVKTRALYERPIVLAAVDPLHAHAKPARLDDAILDYGNCFARAFSGSLHAVHARAPQLDVPSYDIVSDRRADILRTRLDVKARAALDKCAKKARIPRARQHFLSGDPSVVLPTMARTLGADLVVMGAVSRSGLHRLFIGNTAERVLRELHADVLVVKPPSFKRQISRTSRGVRVVSTQRAPAVGRAS
jgi:universal stress protein E